MSSVVGRSLTTFLDDTAVIFIIYSGDDCEQSYSNGEPPMHEHQSVSINFTKKDEVQKILQNEPLISSNHAIWNGVYFEYRKSAPDEVPQHSSQQHLIIINTQVNEQTQYEQQLGDHIRHDQMKEGDVIIIPANVENGARWYTEHCYVLLIIDTSLFRNSALTLTDSHESVLIPQFAKPDPFLYGTGLALKQELELIEGTNQFYIDSLTAAMIAYLARNYTTHTENVKYFGSLSKKKTKQVIDYINDNLYKNISLDELAKLVAVTPNYFSTAFKRVIGISPHQYIIRCKIGQAKQLLINRDLSIARIAHDLRFSHQSHLNYHFKRLVGVTPKYFREHC